MKAGGLLCDKSNRNVGMFLKRVLHLFRDLPAFAGKIVLLDRVEWFEREGASGPSENHAWYLFNKKHRGPPTISYAGRAAPKRGKRS
jgi:hypothetical protein